MLQIDESEEGEVGEWGEDVDLDGVSAEEFDSADAVGVEDVVDVVREVVADGGRRDGDARCPLVDEVFDVEETMVAGGLEVFSELGGGEIGCAEGFGADRPHSGDPGKAGANA